jgi:hypothetical protein
MYLAENKKQNHMIDHKFTILNMIEINYIITGITKISQPCVADEIVHEKYLLLNLCKYSTLSVSKQRLLFAIVHMPIHDFDY